MKPLRRSFLAACVLLLSACAHPPAPALSPPAPVILVSIDGLRWDYVDRGYAPTLAALAAGGARATMRPSFPTKTFPNHYTLVTGLRPDRHGVIGNTMEDPDRPGVVFTLSDREVASDPIWWRDAAPIWVTAERAGVRTGTMFWPGSDFELHGVRPSQWRAFDQTMSSEARVDTLLSWFDLPEGERPRFFTLYFDIVDTAGHTFGPDAAETNAAMAQADAAIARLLAALEARGLGGGVNLIIVGDHGMTEQYDDRIVDLDAFAPPALARVVWDGEFAGVEPAAGRSASELEAALAGRQANMQCWPKRDLPTRFHYGAHPRAPAVICLADLGWRLRTATSPSHDGVSHGGHGYDNAAADMATMFIANGPAIRPGARLPPFDNVSVYPLLAHLLTVAPESNDGRWEDIAPALMQQ